MDEPQNSYVLTEKGIKKLHKAKKEFGRDMSWWICLAGAGGYITFRFLDESIFSNLVHSFSQRRRYSMICSATFFSMILYHGYKISNDTLLRKKIEIRKNQDNILEQLY